MQHKASLITPVLIVGCMIIIVSFGVRASYGVFQIPIATEFGWARSEFSMAIAIQNLAWGIGQPIFGALAEKFGDRKAILIGILIYAMGLFLSAESVTALGHQFNSVLVGFGVAGTGVGLILASVGRAASDKNRSMALAIAAASGSVGQIVGPSLAEWLLTIVSWQSVFMMFAAAVAALVFLLPGLQPKEPADATVVQDSLSQILAKAFRDPSFTLIFLGFFSCGYQLAFVFAHFPAFVTELCGPIQPGGLLDSMGIRTTSALGAVAISLVGLANIGGTLMAGWLGGRFQKKNVLVWIYTGRTLVSVAFIMLPITPLTVILFSVSMGALWLATVPLTSGLIGYIYGLRFMGTLFGIVFFSHQLGGFLGVWLGGRMYDAFGDYTMVWWIGIGISAFSALVHIPIRERPLAAAPA
ncbi:MAG: MFS transporter [Marinibacterium sp.]|nr:MFS transporter [Marinibacterium sp.]